MSGLTEAEANQQQIALCRAEVDRIRASGERYHNGRLVDSLSLRELVALRRQLGRIYSADFQTDARTMHPGARDGMARARSFLTLEAY